MARDEFLAQLEERLEENRRIMGQWGLPKPLWGVASYLGSHSLRVLLGVSFLIALFGFWQLEAQVMRVSRWWLQL